MYTLIFVSHKTPMPQIYYVDRVLMAARGMDDALKHPHPDVPCEVVK
jgi:hypothetical protein